MRHFQRLLPGFCTGACRLHTLHYGLTLLLKYTELSTRYSGWYFVTFLMQKPTKKPTWGVFLYILHFPYGKGHEVLCILGKIFGKAGGGHSFDASLSIVHATYLETCQTLPLDPPLSLSRSQAGRRSKRGGVAHRPPALQYQAYRPKTNVKLLK